MKRQGHPKWLWVSVASVVAFTIVPMKFYQRGGAQTYVAPLPVQPASWVPAALEQDGTSAARGPASRASSADAFSGLTSVLAAGSSAVSAAPERSADLPSSTFTMADVERFRLRVLGSTEYGGEYTVDPDQMISIPTIGRLAVGKLSVAELEALFVSKLSSVARREAAVAIEVVRFQPYYIVGHISEPGAQEWRPGLNVVQAVAVARGVRSPDASGEAAGERGLSREQAINQLQFALVQWARLKAEKEGKQTLTTPDRLDTLLRASSPTRQSQLRTFISQQNAMLGEQSALMQGQLNALNREREAAVAELNETRIQSDQMATQLGISRSLLKDIGKLKDSQLVANSRYLQQRSELISVEIRFAEIRTLMERARSRLSGIASQIQRVQQERQAALNDRIEALEREMAQLELTAGDTGRSASSAGQSMMVQITRKQDNEVRTFTASVFSAIRPGDVVIVSGSEPGSASNRVAENGSALVTLRALEASASSARLGSSSSSSGTVRR